MFPTLQTVESTEKSPLRMHLDQNIMVGGGREEEEGGGGGGGGGEGEEEEKLLSHV